jgi:uroporphyrinogen decarboxylase
MRQAGRYQPEYRALRQQYSLLELVENPDLCCQVTALPVEQLGVDAAILFSDIMVPLGPIGVAYEIREGIGPVIAEPIRTLAAIESLRPLDVSGDLPFLAPTIKQLEARLSVPLIGFAGAPFTLASYLVEGGPSRQYLETKRLWWSEPETWKQLMQRLTDMVIAYAAMQVQAGAKALMLFDSWAGSLALGDFNRAVRPYLEQIFLALEPLKVPRIYFAVGAGHLLASVATLPLEVIGVDWRQPLTQVRQITGPRTLQGNLDPAMMQAPWSVIETATKEILMEGQDGSHIFNLGHGVLPSTDGSRLKRLVDLVHECGSHLGG